MKTIKYYLPRSDFARSIATLSGGTLVSQAIALLASPFLTRLYSPADFGYFAVFIAITNVLLILSTGQYELAITLPRRKRDTFSLVYLIWLLSTLSSFAIFGVLSLIEAPFLRMFGANFNLIIFYIPLAVLFLSIYQSLHYVGIRQRRFKLLASGSILNALSTITLQLLLAQTSIRVYGLVLSYFTSTLLVAIFYARILIKENSLPRPVLRNIVKNMSKYRKFPLLNTPSLLINVLANQVPNIFLNTSFGAAFAGQYALTNRVSGSPAALLSKAFLDAFKERASHDYREKGNSREIFLQTFKALSLIGLLPFSILFFFGPMIFPAVFGQEWSIAGSFARILALVFYARFVISPLSYMLVIAEKQELNLTIQSLILLLILMSLTIGYAYKDVYLFLKLFAFTYILMYLVTLAFSFRYSKRV